MSPAASRSQQRFFGRELAKKRKGQKTETGLSEAKLSEMASAPKGGMKKLPEKVKAKAKAKK